MRKTKKTLAILAIVAMVVAMLPVQVFAADAPALGSRVFGQTQYDTAVEISKQWSAASKIVLAPGEKANLVDALAAGPLAATLDAPILLTDGNTLSAATQAQITALGAKTVYVTSGTAVIKAAVRDQLTKLGLTIVDDWGQTAADTSVAIAKEMVKAGASITQIALANGTVGAQDALSVASFAGALKMPILVTDNKDTLPTAVSDYIATLTGVTKAYAVGGPAVISAAQAAAFKSAEQVYGTTAYDTNDKVIQKFATKFDNVFIANGETLVDALAGAPLAAKKNAAIVLTDGTSTTASTFVNSKLSSTSLVTALGGTAVVPAAVVSQVVYTAPAVLSVQSVSAVNLNQVVVKFTQPVDETAAETAANYSLGGVDLTANDKFDLASDKETLTINLNTVQTQYATSTFKVKGNLVTGDGASSTTVPAYLQDLTFSDTAVPTVTGVSVTGNKTITVKLSETVKIVNVVGVVTGGGTKFKLDGQYLTNYGFSSATASNLTTSGYTNKIVLAFATAIAAGDHTFTTLAGDATNLIDAAGFKAVEQSTTINIAAVTDAPTISSVTGSNNGTIYVTYNRAMDTNALTAANYQMNGTTLPYAGTFTDSTKTVVKFTGITNVAVGADVLTVVKNTVSDSYGNKLDANNDTRISFNATSDTVKPTVVSVTPLSNTKVRVKFSEAVSDAYATNLANYKLTDSTGTTVTLSVNPAAVGTAPTDTYDITTPALTGSNYSLQIKNIVDTAAVPNVIDTYTATFNGIDNIAPTVTEADQVGTSPSQKVAVIFSEAMDSTTISTAANYFYIDNAGTPVTRALPSGTTLVPGSDNKSVLITFPSSYLVNGLGATPEYNVTKIVIGNVKDVAGNILSNFSDTKTINAAGAGTVFPTYVDKTLNVTGTATKVTVQFQLNQDITTLVKEDFLVGAGTAQVANATNLVADSAYISGKNIVLEYTTPANVTALKGIGTGIKLTTVAVLSSTNIYGTKAAAITVASAKPVYEFAIAPELLAITQPTATTINLKFSEAIDDTILGLYTDDFTVQANGQVITVSSAAIATTTVPNDTVVLNLATPVSGTVVVKAVPANISIKSLDNDVAGTSDLYVPVTSDTDGTKGTIADALAPTASVAIATVKAAAGTVTTAQSTELGTIYLVPSADASATKAALDVLVAGGTATSAPVTAINTNTTLSTAGLADGTYKVKAVDAAGNVSVLSANAITVDATAPTAADTATVATATTITIALTDTNDLYIGATKINDSADHKALYTITGANAADVQTIVVDAVSKVMTITMAAETDGNTATVALGTIKDAAGNSIVGAVTAAKTNVTILGAVGVWTATMN